VVGRRVEKTWKQCIRGVSRDKGSINGESRDHVVRLSRCSSILLLER
jgi:hypothetical protein